MSACCIWLQSSWYLDIERTEYSFLNLIEFKLQNNAKPHPISIDFTYSNANATQNYYVPINLLRLRRAQMARNLSIKIDMPMKLCGNVLDISLRTFCLGC